MRLASEEEIPGRAALSVGNVGPSPPEGWVRARLTDIARLESGHTPSRRHPEYWDGDVPWVSIRDARLHDGGEIHETLQTITEEGLANSAARWLPKETVCLSRTASVGYVVVLGRPMATSQDFVNWVCSSALDHRFLKYALAAEGDHLREFGKGTTHTTIYFPAVLALQICLPPVAEQRRIVDRVEALLCGVNAARSRLAKVPLMLRRFRQSVLAAACAGRLTEEWRQRPTARVSDALPEASLDDVPAIPEIPEDWKLVPLRAVVERFQYGTSDKANGDERTGIPMLRMGNVQDGRIDLSALKYVSPSKLRREFLVQAGDVLFNRTNSPELVGKTAVVQDTRPMVFASYLIRMRTNPSLVTPEFLSHWLNSGWGRQWARQVRTDGVGQSNINATKLASMPIALPTIAEQREITARIDKLLDLANTIERRVMATSASADALAQGILAKAFRGELVPNEAELARAEGRDYESAEALLARIHSKSVVNVTTPNPRKAASGVAS
jgi:type I restriction enzyme S subunit